jgi:hypothetical protein
MIECFTRKQRVRFLLSEEDADLASLVWASVKPKAKHYITRNKPKAIGGTIYLHRLVAERMGHDMSDRTLNVDHMNGDTTDNRRENLRIVSLTENARNRVGWKNSKSGIMGVGWDNSRQKWTAYIGDGTPNGIKLGRFDTKEEALEARLAAERRIWGVHPQREHLFEGAA